MPRDTTELDRRRDKFVFALLFDMKFRGGIKEFKANRLHEVFGVYLFILAVYGVRNLDFFKNPSTGKYPSLDDALSEAVNTERYLYQETSGPADEFYFKDMVGDNALKLLDLERWEVSAVRQASIATIFAYRGIDSSFEELLKEVHRS